MPVEFMLAFLRTIEFMRAGMALVAAALMALFATAVVTAFAALFAAVFHPELPAMITLRHMATKIMAVILPKPEHIAFKKSFLVHILRTFYFVIVCTLPYTVRARTLQYMKKIYKR